MSLIHTQRTTRNSPRKHNGRTGASETLFKFFILISSQRPGSFVCRGAGGANYQLFDLAGDAEPEPLGSLTT